MRRLLLNMTPAESPKPVPLIDQLKDLAAYIEVIDVPGRGEVLSLYNPDGIETKPFLDKDHLPRVTKFETVVLFPPLSHLIGENPNGPAPGRNLHGDPQLLQTISRIASSPKAYDLSPEGSYERRQYSVAMVRAGGQIFIDFPERPKDLVVGVVRCGDNIARWLGKNSARLEAKRLRFADDATLLGAGVNLPDELLSKINPSTNIRLFEGVVASGSTQMGITSALRNRHIEIAGLDCDAVVGCPAGLHFSEDFRKAVGVPGINRSVFTVGTLDVNWYVRYHREDPLLSGFADASNYVGKQVLGDGGDLTSNL